MILMFCYTLLYFNVYMVLCANNAYKADTVD
jgi:hypothetical protein